MKRFWPGRRAERGPRRPSPDPGPGALAKASKELEIEELEPRLTPDYWGQSSVGGGSSPGRTVGWGC
jgi:hypothetical protein